MSSTQRTPSQILRDIEASRRVSDEQARRRQLASMVVMDSPDATMLQAVVLEMLKERFNVRIQQGRERTLSLPFVLAVHPRAHEGEEPLTYVFGAASKLWRADKDQFILTGPDGSSLTIDVREQGQVLLVKQRNMNPASRAGERSVSRRARSRVTGMRR